MDAAMEHVPSHGWSMSSLRNGAADLGWSPAATGIVARGEADLVLHFVHKSNARLADALEGNGDETLGASETATIEERLAAALKFRLAMLEPHVSTWPQAIMY